MKTPAITLMEAYMIENLRKKGITDEELVQINEALIEAWQVLDERYDYQLLKNIKEQNPATYGAIIRKGYKVKFLTLNGLVNLLELKFNKQREQDFNIHDNGISGLQVNSEEQEHIAQILSANWLMTETEQGLSIRA